MIIHQPKITYELDKVIVAAEYESNNKKDLVWYSFDRKYEDYLVTENADAFLVSLLLLAMKNNEDIEVYAPISARLYYQLNHYLIRALNLANDEWNLITINAKTLNDEDLNVVSSSGTGISGGVDSFATIVDHLDEKGNFPIDYFTFFNAGSHGEFGGEQARSLYKKRLELMRPYAEEVNKEIITVDTNLNEILMMNHEKTHTIRSIACILNLQKLFKYYYYASAYRFNHYELADVGMGSYDLLVLNMLSTESTTFYSAVSQFSRVERTEYINEYLPSHKYLNVCTRSSSTGMEDNCSSCNKCLRTQFTLELQGKLENYEEVFDFDTYNKNKDRYIGQVLADRNNNMLTNEIYHLMKEKKYKMNGKSYVYFLKYQTKNLIKNILPVKLIKQIKKIG